jgi:hypothetical protein
MQGLYPIVRRVRRPLTVIEPATVAGPIAPAIGLPVEPVPPVAETVVAVEPPKSGHEKVSGKKHAR